LVIVNLPSKSNRFLFSNTQGKFCNLLDLANGFLFNSGLNHLATKPKTKIKIFKLLKNKIK